MSQLSLGERVEQALKSAFADSTTVQVEDQSSGCGGAKLTIIIVSDQFAGMKLLERHRAVQVGVSKHVVG